jgi:hypothetical protein
VAGVGDVNGEGYDDVIVTAFNRIASPAEGAAFVFLGSATGIASGGTETAAAQLDSGQSGDRLFLSVAGAGDVNGDGYDDVILGDQSRDENTGEPTGGGAFVFPGGASGVADTAFALPVPNQQPWVFGASVAAAGDVNGDGLGDMIVGGGQYSSADYPEEGAALVFLGEIEDRVVLYGQARGGTVTVTVDQVPITVVTTAGQTPAQVVAALAAAINADPTLAALGTTALAIGNALVTNGTISSVTIGDPGLTPTPIPALHPAFQVALALLLAAVARGVLRRRGPAHPMRPM